MNSSFFLGSVAVAIGFFTFLKKFRVPQETEDTISSSSSSLPSSPPSLSRTWNRHVFPSFYGADVRRNFLSHVLESFKRKGIETFIDNNIERNNSIGPELVEAIKGSKIAIVLLSRKYSSSSWCLDELVEIMKCREALGQIVMTIFYEVDPTDIKKQAGDFGKAFRKTCKGKTKEHIEKWKKALEDVAKIAGEHSLNWDNEADMIEKIADDLSNILNNSTPSRNFDGLVGMKTHMEVMEGLLRLDLDEVRMIGIWGPPGIGKTTIARVLFNQVSSRFQLGAIMVDIKGCYKRLCLDEYNAQLQLQNQMLSQIINQKDIKISHLGVAKECLQDKKVLLVLDDVDQSGQLEALAKETRWFGPGSRIIIITQDLSILDAHRINHIYKVNFPSSDEAFQIFCMNAFGQKHPYDGFYDLTREVTEIAGDLPFGLKVLGSALKGKSKREWEKTLPRLKTRLDKDIGSIVKFRYDALHDEDKYLFLYIACLFNYESTDKVEEVLAKHLCSVRQGLHILVQKSLISIECRRIYMHPLLQQFGREISKKEFVHHGHAKRQLLVGAKDICEVLSDDTTDCRHFIGINLDLSEIEEELNIIEKAIERLRDFQFVKINGKDLAHPKRLHSLLYHSQKIRSLHWRYFHNKCLPSNFNPEFLVELNMQGSKLEKLWAETKTLRNLKWIDLSHSTYLKELPDLSTATNLEELIIEDCSSLVELPSSIGNLQQLYWLGMCGCSKLQVLPTNINLKSLLTLDLRDCSRLKSFPEISTNIEDLNLTGTAIKEVPLSIMSWSRLYEFQMSYFESLKDFPHALDIITELHLVDKDIKEVPPWIKGMSRLDKFRLYNCNSLVSLPQLSDSLSDLVAENCDSLERLDGSFNNPNIRLEFVNCFKLNQEAKDLIMHTPTSECEILPGTEVPACFNHRATAGGSLTIKLNDSPFPTSLRFKACIMPVKVKHEKERPMFVDIDIMDKQKCLKVQCTPSHRLIYPLLTEHIYTYEVEVNEVTSTELFFEFRTDNRNWKIGECGLLQILEVPSF